MRSIFDEFVAFIVELLFFFFDVTHLVVEVDRRQGVGGAGLVEDQREAVVGQAVAQLELALGRPVVRRREDRVDTESTSVTRCT